MNTIDMKGRIAVITGGAQGIGFATAERFVASGAAVVLWDIDTALLAKAQAALGDKFDPRAFHAEVLKDGSVPLSVLEGKIDRWINTQK